MARTIALLTDFGLEDGYVGVMKGVMRTVCKDVDFIDITHLIEPQNVRRAALALVNAYQYFPAGTIFLVVVDPGVGSTRRPIAMTTENYTFVAPDNGVLSYVLAEEVDRDDADEPIEIVELSNTKYHLDNLSYTFHGRDVFAPVAGHLAKGTALAEFGTKLDQIVELPIPQLTVAGAAIRGEIIDIDRFGNIVTSIGILRWSAPGRLTLDPKNKPEAASVRLMAEDATATLHGNIIYGIQTSYSEAIRGEPLMLVGSSGYLEIAVNQGNAADRFEVTVGDPIEIQLGEVNATIRD